MKTGDRASTQSAEAPSIEDVQLIERRQLREIIPASNMTYWRWMKRGLLPKPICIGGKQYWRRDKILKIASGA
jgi:predicted DNA-binding transcriptional regulator AlpA